MISLPAYLWLTAFPLNSLDEADLFEGDHATKCYCEPSIAQEEKAHSVESARR